MKPPEAVEGVVVARGCMRDAAHDRNDEIDRVKRAHTLFRQRAVRFRSVISREGRPMQQRATVPSVKSMEEAGGALLERAIDPSRWMLPGRRVTVDNRCRVGSVEVCASVDVTPTLETFLRVSFKGPKLSPMQAAELLEQFTSVRYTYVPNIEWFVEIDARQWIHFSRPYTQPRLQA